jgi:predicted dienelactone hydrolase
MLNSKNTVLEGIHNKPILTDLYLQENNIKKPVVIFCHGYKGYKDWGVFDFMAKEFVKNDIVLVKFNFSHNGGTIDQPIDFPDLEAFGQNNYTKEQDDLQSVIDWLFKQTHLEHEINFQDISLIGHSRGGGTVILKAVKETRISRLITWAGVSDYKVRFPLGPILEHWKKEGVAYIENMRTNQQMPHYIQFYNDFLLNEEKLTIKTAAKNLKIPHLIVHGNADTTVPLIEAENLHTWSSFSELFLIPEGNHGFGAKQPWKEANLPIDFQTVLEKTFQFIKNS